jgi:hypothetical protein
MEVTMKVSRHWAMPNHNTFTIKPIAELLRRHIKDKDVVIDPFARDATLGTYTNDLNPVTKAQYHLPADEFCDLLLQQGVVADVGLFDPPYSTRQIKECYDGIGLRLSQRETQVQFAPVKDRLARLLRPGGIAISFGWNSTGFGKCRGFERLETMLVCHGSGHYDTIVCVDRKSVIAPTSKRRRCADGSALSLAG